MGENSFAFGKGNYATGENSIAAGTASWARGENSFALGLGAETAKEADEGVAVGNKATANAENSVAIGAHSIADEKDTFSVGNDEKADDAVQRRITHVAAGTKDTDAANVSQLNSQGKTSLAQFESLAAALGGDAKVNVAGSLITPSYSIQGAQYHNVGAALGALDGSLTKAWASINSLQNPPPGTRQFGPFVAIDGKGDGSDKAAVKADTSAVAIGAGAKAGDDHGVAIGGGSYAAGPGDTAVGGNAKVLADGSTALGSNAQVSNSTATNALAVGADSNASAASGTAVGQGASASASGAVALGQGAVADRANTVSVGNSGLERQITHVAAGTQATDAANMAQIRDALQTAKTYSDAGTQATLNQSKAYTDKATADFSRSIHSELNDRFGQVNTRIDRVGAMNAASTQMAINAAGATGNGRIAAGVGLQGGRSALSVGYATPLGSKLHMSMGVTASGSEASAGVGLGVDL
jgi:trimeric autotransporter adhesin